MNYTITYQYKKPQENAEDIQTIEVIGKELGQSIRAMAKKNSEVIVLEVKFIKE